MRLIQFLDDWGQQHLGVVEGTAVCDVTSVRPELISTYLAFQAARADGRHLEEYLAPLVAAVSSHDRLDYERLLHEKRVLAPVTETAVVPLIVSGTGLTHLGSAQQRDAMHAAAGQGAQESTVEKSSSPPPAKSDSRKMFELGLTGGRPADGIRGAAPEWFYKGDGRILRGPGQPLEIPDFAPDGGEEPELVGVYIIDESGTPRRLGFTQGNEWSDHVTENINYLYLAPSKLRTCAIGPELVTDFAFDDVKLRCRVLRDDKEIYCSGELLSGERNMCHSLANLEDHHFKFPQHRHPGDIHVHFFGTSKLSYPGREWKYAEGDVVEVSVDGLGPPLQNPVRRVPFSETSVRVERG